MISCSKGRSFQKLVNDTWFVIDLFKYQRPKGLWWWSCGFIHQVPPMPIQLMNVFKLYIACKSHARIIDVESYFWMAAKKFCHYIDVVVSNDLIWDPQYYWFLESVHVNNLFQIIFSYALIPKIKIFKVWTIRQDLKES